ILLDFERRTLAGLQGHFNQLVSMLDGIEWLIIGAIAIVVILWGPAKIPEFAKALGRAKGEFTKAQNEFTKAASETPQTSSVTTFNVPPPPALKSRDEVLIDAARSLGISTEGKTRDQISEEISLKAKLLNSD
ncbi:MAG: twin-arginine translocase TatA/TatE family subunit, partial [Candidatus Bathyarchaeia archaeon]